MILKKKIENYFALLTDKYWNLHAAYNDLIYLVSKDSKINQSIFDKEYENITSYTGKCITLKIKTERMLYWVIHVLKL